MRIGIIIGRIGGEDGVALETLKWEEVLRRMGHDVYYLSGLFEDSSMLADNTETLGDLSFHSETCILEQDKAFYNPDESPVALLELLENKSEEIFHAVKNWLGANRIEVLISENASALPAHLSMGMGIRKVILDTGIPTIAHDHDFAWERGERYVSPHSEINNLIAEVFPLRAPSVIHAAINQHGKNTFKDRFDIDAVAVPNVMDFEIPFGQETDHNQQLLGELGIGKDSVPLFQVTRIVERKKIETALELIEKLDHSKYKLVITGDYVDDHKGGYFQVLKEEAVRRGIKDQVFFAANIIAGTLSSPQNHKYSISDAYGAAQACTYFSNYEGFGNAFVEAVCAKKPIFVNNYKPVYMPDIGSKGFQTVMLEDNVLTDNAVTEIKDILNNKNLGRDIGEFNYSIAKKHFSYDALEGLLSQLLAAH